MACAGDGGRGQGALLCGGLMVWGSGLPCGLLQQGLFASECLALEQGVGHFLAGGDSVPPLGSPGHPLPGLPWPMAGGLCAASPGGCRTEAARLRSSWLRLCVLRRDWECWGRTVQWHQHVCHVRSQVLFPLTENWLLFCHKFTKIICSSASSGQLCCGCFCYI